jgi:hypothetical protein
MGEVYRAHDTRLGRDVAVKVLAGSVTTDTDSLQRFEREAHAVAALTHPNIVSIHSIETIDGLDVRAWSMYPRRLRVRRSSGFLRHRTPAFGVSSTGRRTAAGWPQAGSGRHRRLCLTLISYVERPIASLETASPPRSLVFSAPPEKHRTSSLSPGRQRNRHFLL